MRHAKSRRVPIISTSIAPGLKTKFDIDNAPTAITATAIRTAAYLSTLGSSVLPTYGAIAPANPAITHTVNETIIELMRITATDIPTETTSHMSSNWLVDAHGCEKFLCAVTRIIIMLIIVC